MSIRGRKFVRNIVECPSFAMFSPALALSAFWLGGEVALLTVAVVTPVILAFSGWGKAEAATDETPLQRALHELRRAIDDCQTTGRKSACFILMIDDLDTLSSRHGVATTDQILSESLARIGSVMRSGDKSFRIADNRFAVVLAPTSRCDLETGISLSGRIQSTLEAPFYIDGLSLYLSASCGFCLSSKSPKPTADSLLEAAQVALNEAQAQGGGAIRAFSEAMKSRVLSGEQITGEIETALETGQIRAWFQPQVSSDSGDITGFEALVRWEHPDRGMLPPCEFLPIIEKAGFMPRLTDVMLSDALSALTTWDRDIGGIPKVSINLSQQELSDPNLADRIKWTLDRFDVTHDRLGVEILENVVAASADDVVTRTLSKLSGMGCQIDLDDFGMGQTSITSIRRLSINRLKIDRSFITRLNEDPEQQRMVEAILTMAERLQLETVAEGVETVGEYARASLLGCTHIQGFAIAQPMPLGKTIPWIRQYRAKLAQVPQLGGRKA